MSSLILHESTTSVAKTPPPALDKTNNNNYSNGKQKRLDFYKSVFNQQTDDVDKNTGLFFSSSLNYILHTFLFLDDSQWVLAMIDIDGLKDINDKLGYSGANEKIEQIGTIICKFCNKNKVKLKGYKCNDVVSGKGDLFGVLIKCEIRMDNSIDFTVSIGCSKLIEDDLGMPDDWYQRVNDNLKQAKKNGKNQICFGKGETVVRVDGAGGAVAVAAEDNNVIDSSGKVPVKEDL